MSEASKTQVSQDERQVADDPSKQPNRDESPEALLRQFRDAAAEAKKYRQANADLNAKLEAIENEKLAQEGKWKEMAEKEKARAEKAEREAREKHARFALRTVETQVKAEAAKLGCVDTDAVLKLMNLSELEVDENYQVDSGAMKASLESLKKEKSYLFPKEAAHPRDLPPANGREGLKEKSVKDMTVAEMQAFLMKR